MSYTNGLDDPSAHFQTAIYSGSNSQQAITNDGNSDLKPDWLWIKQRSSTENHMLVDSTRGVSKYLLSSSNIAEQTVTSRVETLDTDGFTVNGASNPVNALGATYVAWQWKANGGTTSSNTDGTITSTVQANTDAGFSIVTWAGTNSTATIGHGLGVAPKFMIVRARDKNVPTSWVVFHKDGSTSDDDYFILQTTAAKATQAGLWNNQYPSSTVFGVANDFWVNSASTNYIAYCFAEKQGYSKLGKYVGNGSADGTFVYTGFRPAFVLVKNASAVESWVLYDTTRNPYNVADLKISPNTGDNENGNSGIGGATYNNIDILSNGFKCRSNNAATNGSGNTIIYMAFAENPFVAGGIPTTAR